MSKMKLIKSVHILTCQSCGSTSTKNILDSFICNQCKKPVNSFKSKDGDCTECRYFSTDPLGYPCGRCVKFDEVTGLGYKCESFELPPPKPPEYDASLIYESGHRVLHKKLEFEFDPIKGQEQRSVNNPPKASIHLGWKRIRK